MKKQKQKKTARLQAQQAPAPPYAKVVGRPGTGSYPAPSSDPTTLNAHLRPMPKLIYYSSILPNKCTREQV